MRTNNDRPPPPFYLGLCPWAILQVIFATMQEKCNDETNKCVQNMRYLSLLPIPKTQNIG